jgi:hypothetical protein
MVHVVEHLPSKYKVLPQYHQKKTKNKKPEDGHGGTHL